MMGMHEQLHLLGVRRAEFLVAHPQKSLSLPVHPFQSALIPLSPPFLMLGSAPRTRRCAT
jgi:hypothetical protein